MKKKTLLQSSGFVTLFASLVCIAIGLLFGFLVLLLLGGDKAYSDGFKQILLGGFYMMPSGIGKEIVTAAPLIMCGLSVAFAFKYIYMFFVYKDIYCEIFHLLLLHLLLQ